MTTVAGLDDPRLNRRLKVALLAALILHAVVFIAVQLRAAALIEERPRALTVQLQPDRETPPKPAPKPAPTPRKEAPAPTPAPAAKVPVPTREKPVENPRSQPVPTPPAPSATPTAPLPAASRPTAAPQAAPAPVVANRPPPPPAVSREEAAAAAQKLARAALQPLAPTPDAGEAPTNYGAPVAAAADKAPAPVASESQRPSVGGPATDYDDETANQREIGGYRRDSGRGQSARGQQRPGRRRTRRRHGGGERARRRCRGRGVGRGRQRLRPADRDPKPDSRRHRQRRHDLPHRGPLPSRRERAGHQPADHQRKRQQQAGQRRGQCRAGNEIRLQRRGARAQDLRGQTGTEVVRGGVGKRPRRAVGGGSRLTLVTCDTVPRA